MDQKKPAHEPKNTTGQGTTASGEAKGPPQHQQGQARQQHEESRPDHAGHRQATGTPADPEAGAHAKHEGGHAGHTHAGEAHGAKHASGDHSALCQYPDDPRPAIDVLLGHCSGQCSADTQDVVHAAWHLAGYGASQFDTHEPQPEPAASHSSAAGQAGDEVAGHKVKLRHHLEQIKQHFDGPSRAVKGVGIPWMMVLDMLYQLVKELLQPKPEPQPQP